MRVGWAFARIENYGGLPTEFQATLELNGELLDARNVSIDANSNTSISFDITNVQEGKLKLELDINDDLAIDNVAFAGLDPPRQLEVLIVTDGNRALEAALATQAAVRLASVRMVGRSVR